MKKTLPMLLAEKDELTRMIVSEEEGKLDEYLLEQWRGNELELKDKIDGYGYVLDNITAEVNKLQQLKAIHTDRIKAAITRFENEARRLRKRLYEHTEGKPLRGNEYSFHPYIGENRTVNLELVEPEYCSYTIPKLTYEEYIKLIELITGYYKDSELYRKCKRATPSCNVSDLPKGHPALLTELRYDVRIT